MCIDTRVKSRDKADRATTEQVMDPRTRMMLFKMINRQLFTEVNGCISTGKEANVYHARRADGSERAIKVCRAFCKQDVRLRWLTLYVALLKMYILHPSFVAVAS